MPRFWSYMFAFLLLFYGCDKEEEKQFRLLTSESTGITFSNTLTDTSELNILTYLYFYNGGGVAAGDYNGDGLVDLYFTGNQVSDKLYLNSGNLQFEDITEPAGISDSESWSTGVTHADVNADGLLDIYVCTASGYSGLSGKNRLYINRGNDPQGIPQFEESASEYGLDFEGLSTQAGFLDYDRDGDLDMYLMNHSVHPNRAYGKGTQRTRFDPRSGDRLYRNDDGNFTEVGAEAGIYQSQIGYGLGLAIGDMNSDDFPDIYVGNDFFENDYLYLNQRDGTFEEIISKDISRLGHTSHFSMGNNMADINNDGLNDLISVDMLPYKLETYKSAGLEYAYPIYAGYLKNGYAPQYMQNTLHVNLGNTTFSEIAHLAGISATDWSWSPLLADFDNDGLRDLYITNGIKGATNDMDFIRFISNDEIQKTLDQGMQEQDLELVTKIPPIKVPNHFFKNEGDLKFSDQTELWTEAKHTYSNGAVYADLDNDGDLDLIVSNVDEEAHILENRLNNSNGFLTIRFQGSKGNRYGIGAKVWVYNSGNTLLGENYSTKGYLSAIPPELHFGLHTGTKIDSLKIQWPTGATQLLRDVASDTLITLVEQEATPPGSQIRVASKNRDSLTLDFVHNDGTSIEFSRNPLVPFANTNEGPRISAADLNRDGKIDLFLGGGKFQPSALFVQDESGKFTREQDSLFQQDKRSEDVAQVLFDANGDSWPDLLVVSGGNEFKEGLPLQPRLYINDSGTLRKDSTQFTDITVNASSVSACDIDNDGDTDVLITADQIPWEFGSNATQYLFENDGNGQFTLVNSSWAPEFENLGNVKDAHWTDLNGDGYKDLILAGHWMPIQVYMNSGSRLALQDNNGLEYTNGWWNTLLVHDLDKDGDLDLVAGNFGENSKLRTSAGEPITLYRYDFDENGTTETLVTHFHDGQETPFASKDELVTQMPYLNKEYLSYAKFANASFSDVFPLAQLEMADKKYAFTLESAWFENDGTGQFTPHRLPEMAQASVVHDIGVIDHNNDTYPDLYLIGNNYEISTQLGRMDALHGLILRNDQKKGFQWLTDPDLMISGPARSLVNFMYNGKNYLGVGINNAAPVFLQLKTGEE